MNIVCSKCKIEKPLDQYQTYFHSTQQKMRTRKVCTVCYREQARLWKQMNKKKPQLETPVPVVLEDFSNNPDYNLCKKCEKYVHNDNWYWSKRSTNKNKEYRSAYCRVCCNLRYGKDYQKSLREKGGSEFVKNKPGEYRCPIQKGLVFKIMRNFNYVYNEEYNVWLKPDIKELVDGKIVFTKVKPYKKKHVKLTPQEINKIHQYHKEGLSFIKISKIINRHPSTVYKRLQTHEPTFKARRS